MKHDIKLTDKKVTVYLQNEKECKLIEFYMKNYQGEEIHTIWAINNLKNHLHKGNINTTEYLHLRAALVDIVAQFNY